MKASWMLVLITALMLSACSRQPMCSVASGDVGAPSAGCLVLDQGELLLVKIMDGTYGPPGGSADSNESAQCAAERETWEETGVQVSAGELAAEFDTGFHLYWYAPKLFHNLKWRYADQADIIKTLMSERQE
jgi:8-oxo-dGTP diphosphatase